MADKIRHDFRLFVPKQAVGASLVYFDLYNASGSGFAVHIASIQPVVSGAVAVTGVVGVDLLLTGTTAIGTGGTAATFGGTDTTACTISGLNPKNTFPTSSITARLTPSGGATAGRVLTWCSLFTEETSSGAYQGKLNDLVNLFDDSEDIVVPEGTGIRIVQGAVASVGNIGFNIAFGLTQTN